MSSDAVSNMSSDAVSNTSSDAVSNTPHIVYPCLYYRDGAEMIEWLERAFGFEKRMAVTDEEGKIAHSELTFGDAVIMVSTAKTDKPWRSPLDLGGASATLCFYVSDPDAHHERAVAAGAEITIPLTDTDYGSRDYTAKDPEGTFWTFGTYIPGAFWEKKES